MTARSAKRLTLAIGILLLAGIGLVAFAYATAISDPVVRRTSVTLPGYPADERPLKAVLISDLHVAGPDMPPERLSRIVAQINALEPDIVFLAGDFISDKQTATHLYALRDAMAPLIALRPPLGAYAVLGNHDHWRNAALATRTLRRNNITVLNNQAVRAGPLVVGGLDDPFTHHDNVPGTVAAMRALGRPGVLISHSPDPFATIAGDIPLMLAGHTHCGQIRFPIIGAISHMSEYGDRYACGVVRERGSTLVVGAGVGTSIVPLRLGAVPDMWLISLGGGPD